MRRTGPSDLVRTEVIFRDGMSCRRCGATPGSQIHHRAPRQRGGTKAPWINGKANLVLLCIDCHDHIERNRAEAYEQGWLVRRNSNDRPEEVPLTDTRGRSFFLTDSGEVIQITKGAA